MLPAGDAAAQTVQIRIKTRAVNALEIYLTMCVVLLSIKKRDCWGWGKHVPDLFSSDLDSPEIYSGTAPGAMFGRIAKIAYPISSA
jgi:hypothetical protein